MKLVGPVFITCHFNIVHSGLKRQSPEGNWIRDIGFHKPAPVFNPRIRSFLLQPVFKFLLEQPQVIIQPDPVAAHSQRSDGIQKARRKTAQTAVSKGRLRLQLFDLAEVFTVFRKDIPHFLIDPQIDHIVRQQLSDQKFCGNIVDLFLFLWCFLFFCKLLYRLQERAEDFFIGYFCNSLTQMFLQCFLYAHSLFQILLKISSYYTERQIYTALSIHTIVCRKAASDRLSVFTPVFQYSIIR